MWHSINKCAHTHNHPINWQMNINTCSIITFCLHKFVRPGVSKCTINAIFCLFAKTLYSDAAEHIKSKRITPEKLELCDSTVGSPSLYWMMLKCDCACAKSPFYRLTICHKSFSELNKIIFCLRCQRAMIKMINGWFPFFLVHIF